MSDPTAPYKVRFKWSGRDFDNGRLALVDFDTEGIEGEKDTGGSTAEFYSQAVLLEQRKAAFSINKRNQLVIAARRFHYMDVGKWLHGEQYFGVICGGVAAVANYEGTPADFPWSSSGPTEPMSGILPDPKTVPLLYDFLRLPGIHPCQIESDGGDSNRVLCHNMLSRRDPNHLYVILPDIHLPEACPAPSDKTMSARWEACNRKGLHGEQWLPADSLALELNFGSKRDPFKSRDSVHALTRFLSMLANFAEISRDRFPDARITLVQIGDLYELWAHRACYFEESIEPKVVLKKPVDNRAGIVGNWVSNTHFLYHELFQAFDRCHDVLNDGCIFLHGNHDGYLSVPPVVDAANQAQERINYWHSDMYKWHVGGPTRVYYRRKEWFNEGVFFEHGQRADGSNRDGELFGFEGCNKAVASDFWSRFDSVRRRTFVTGAAAMHLVRNGDFGLYVMGHTHSPQLKLVEVSHARSDNGQAIQCPKWRVVEYSPPIEFHDVLGY